MKKFTKVCLITALVLCIISIGCFIAGGILGGNPIRAVKNVFQFGNMMSEDYGADFDEEFEMDDFTLAGEYDKDSIEELDINMSMGSVVIRTVSSDACRVWMDEGNYTESIQISMDKESGKLLIEEESYHDTHFSVSDFALFVTHKNRSDMGTKVIIELPDKEYSVFNGDIQLGAMKVYDLSAEQLSVNIEAGAVYNQGTINGETVQLTVGMGFASLNHLECDTARISVEMGDIQADSIISRELIASVEMGNMKLFRTKTESLSADCEMGDISIELMGEANDYYISTNVEMGDINIEDYVRNNKAGRYEADLDCEMGTIDVTFLKTDE